MKAEIPRGEILALLERANLLILQKDFISAIALYSQLIERTPDESSFMTLLLDGRASIYSMAGDWDSAINDVLTSISLNPDNNGNYLQMGVYITWKHFYSNKFRIDHDNKELNQSIDYYKESLKRDPANITAWLNIVESYLFLMEWDNALCYLGMSKAHLFTKENILIWTWLTCLSLALAGEPVERSDMDMLSDSSEKYETNHDPKQIDCVLSELKRTNYNADRLQRANEIHLLYKDRIGAK